MCAAASAEGRWPRGRRTSTRAGIYGMPTGTVPVARSWRGEPVMRGPAHRSAACAAESVPIPGGLTPKTATWPPGLRVGFYAKFEREVDPEGKLAPQERAKRGVGDEGGNLWDAHWD